MKQRLVFKRKNCRVCLKSNLIKVLDFGPTPLANAFLDKQHVDLEEYFFPLEVYFCNNCSFLQLGHIVSPKTLFNNYLYVSSTSDVFVNHFINFANQISKRFKLDTKSLVIDIGSNDGILLKPFLEKGINVIGIEPAKDIAKVAKKQGIKTIIGFVNVALAKSINKNNGKADLVTATNVFAHIDDLEEVIASVKIMLKKDGVFIIEAPYLVDFIQKHYFDLVYHEHLSYWSLKSLKTLFARHSMEIFDTEKVAVHGGSIRVFIKNIDSNIKNTPNLDKFLKLEKSISLEKIKTYFSYFYEIEKNRIELLSLLTKLKKQGKTIAGYGAPAKGNTLLNYFNIGTNFLEYIIDDSSWKQNLFTPGKRIPVKNFTYLKSKEVDYLLILAWNFSESIIKKNSEFAKHGGKFIIPVPTPKIV